MSSARSLAAAATGIAVAVGVAVPALPAAAAAGPKLSHQDLTFVTETSQGALYEVQAGRVAVKSAGSARVKIDAAEMVRDHSREYTQIKALASQLGVPVKTAPDPDEQAVVKLWTRMHGNSLDCGYAAQEYSDHENDIAGAKDEVEQGSNPALKKFAATWLTTYAHHLSLFEGTVHALAHC